MLLSTASLCASILSLKALLKDTSAAWLLLMLCAVSFGGNSIVGSCIVAPAAAVSASSPPLPCWIRAAAGWLQGLLPCLWSTHLMVLIGSHCLPFVAVLIVHLLFLWRSAAASKNPHGRQLHRCDRRQPSLLQQNPTGFLHKGIAQGCQNNALSQKGLCVQAPEAAA